MYILFPGMTAAGLLIGVAGFIVMYMKQQVITAVLFLILMAAIVELLAKQRINRLNGLRTKANAEDFYSGYEKLYRRVKPNKLNRDKFQMIKLNVALGCLETGRLEQAGEVLLEQCGDIPGDNAPKAQLRRMLYDAYKVMYFIEVHDIDGAEEALAALETEVSKTRTRGEDANARSLYTNLKIRLDVEKGENIKQASEYFRRLASRRQNRINMLALHVQLAKIAWWLQDREALEKEIRFVEANAGQTCFAEQVRALLDTAPDREPEMLNAEIIAEQEEQQRVQELKQAAREQEEADVPELEDIDPENDVF